MFTPQNIFVLLIIPGYSGDKMRLLWWVTWHLCSFILIIIDLENVKT
jgi:hypothetical protein